MKCVVWIIRHSAQSRAMISIPRAIRNHTMFLSMCLVRCTHPIQVFGEVGANKLLERYPYAESSSSRNENTPAFRGIQHRYSGVKIIKLKRDIYEKKVIYSLLLFCGLCRFVGLRENYRRSDESDLLCEL